VLFCAVGTLRTLDVNAIVAALFARAHVAQARAATYTQTQIDQWCLAAGLASMKPARNRVRATLAVRDAGLRNVEDKFTQNRGKKRGLLR
jgi:sulfoacetaldehyde dehydrogenase